jgi:hypothetical protein
VEPDWVLQRRQDLPDEAFITFDELQTAGFVRRGISLIAVSYMWLEPGHPDPRRHNLELLTNVLSVYCSVPSHGTSAHNSPEGPQQRWAVFLDYLSLHQKPRTPREDMLFKKGLEGLGTLYGHMFTRVFRLTGLPLSYPEGYDLGETAGDAGSIVRRYSDRGWCTTETAWCRLTKSGRKCLDLSRYSGRFHRFEELLDELVPAQERPAPLLPLQFEDSIEKTSFTCGKEDKPLVLMLYKAEFQKRFAIARELVYHNLGWTDEHIEQLAEVFRYQGGLPKLRELELDGNKITARGFAILEDTIRQGMMPNLTKLYAGRNAVGSGGADCLHSLRAACDERNILLDLDTDTSDYRPSQGSQ